VSKTVSFFLLLFVFCTVRAQELPNVSISETFNNTSLSKVIRLLKNKYDVKIAYDDALVTGITVSGTYKSKSIAAFLDEILPPKGIDYQVLNGKIILTPGTLNIDLNTPILFDLTIFGIITDAQTGEMLPNALITVSGQSRGTVSNKDGYFALRKVPSDTSTIEVSYLGYEKNQVKLNPVKSKKTIRISMAESTIALAEFTVVDLRSDNVIKTGDEVSQISINPNNLTALPTLGDIDIFRSLQLLPGISGTDETSSALSIRKSPSNHNLVLLDGFTIYRLDHFFGVFSAINPDAVRDIQVFKGGFSPRYGGRVSGVVDITGKSGNFNKTDFSLGINLLSARMSVNTPINKGKGAFHLSYRRAFTDIIRSDLFKNLYKNYRDNSNQLTVQSTSQQNSNVLRPDFKFSDLNMKTVYNLSKRDVASFSLYRGGDDLSTNFNQIRRNSTSILSTENTEEVAKWSNLGFGTTWSRNWNSNYFSSLQVAYSNHNFDYLFQSTDRDENGAVIRDYSVKRLNEVDDFQFNFRNEIKVKKRHNLDFGINLSSISTINDVTIDQEVQQPNNERKQQGKILAFYASDRIKVSDKLTVDLGFRHNITQLTDPNYFGRRLGATYQVTPSFKLKIANGEYFQLARQLVYDDPRSNLQDGWNLANDGVFEAIQSEHIIGGFNYSKNGFMLDVEYYQKNVTGLVELTVSHLVDTNRPGDTRPLTTISNGEDQIRGIDLLIQKKAGPYQGWLSYTYSKADSRYTQINKGETLPSRLDQRNEVKFVHILELTKFNFSATFLYGSGKPFYRPELRFIENSSGVVTNYEILNLNKTVERLPAYHRLDLSAALKFENEELRGEFGLSVLNVYNQLNIQNRRLNVNSIEIAIREGETPQELYRDIVLLDFTPSIFLNLFF
jgi:ferric enterobactin receptor